MENEYNLLKFIISSFAFDLYPGEVFFVVITIVLQYGFRAGIFAALGVALCDLIACLSGVFGLSVIFKTFPQLSLIMKTIGFCYLYYIAISGFIEIWKNKKEIKLEKNGKVIDIKNYLIFTKEVFFISILNPLVYFGDSGMIMQFAGQYSFYIKLFYILIFFLVSFSAFSLLSILFSIQIIQSKLSIYHKKIKLISSFVIFILASSILKEVIFSLSKI